MTANAIPRIAREIREINAKDKPEYTILLMHAGVEGQVKGGIIGEVTYEDLCPMKDTVDYLALGHYHNAYEIDGWVYNPGCPDTCSIAEVGGPKGFYHVIDGKPRLVPVDARKFFVLRASLDGHKSVETLHAAVDENLACLKDTEGSLIHLILEGTLNFDKSRVDLESMSETARERSGALYVDVRFDLMNDEFSVGHFDNEGLNRAAIELEVFRKIGRSDSMTADKCDLFAGSMAEIKDLAAKGADENTLDAVMRKAFEALDMASPPSTIIEETVPVPIVSKPRKKRQPAGGQTSFDTEGGP
jgi:DNA repair exonuclease SbcCD nuclease subunit